MSVPGPRLLDLIRTTVLNLRQLADSLESALEASNHEPARTSVSSRSLEPSEWDLVPPDQSAEVSGARHSDYQALAQLITTVPAHCVDLCSRLGSEAQHRAQRAWEAGYWARAVLENRISKPRPTPKLQLRPCVYIVVRGPGISRPVRVSSAAEYYKLIPTFTEDSLSHSFPSLAEARVYCLALGIDFPQEQ